MRQFNIDILIFVGLLICCIIILLLPAGQSTIDIQIHDTYFVIDKISLTVLIIGPMTFLIFLARGLAQRFRATATNIGLIIGLILIALITYQVIRIQQSYLNEALKHHNKEFPSRGQFIGDIQNKINLTWGIFSFWITGLLLLILQTGKIWKEGYSSQYKL